MIEEQGNQPFAGRYWNELYLGGIGFHRSPTCQCRWQPPRKFCEVSDCVAWRSPVKPNQAAMQCNTNCISVSLFVFGFDEWYNCEIGPNLSCNARHSAKGINIVNLPWDVGKCIGSKSSHRSFIAFIAFFSKLCCRKEKTCMFANLLNWSGKLLSVCKYKYKYKAQVQK